MPEGASSRTPGSLIPPEWRKRAKGEPRSEAQENMRPRVTEDALVPMDSMSIEEASARWDLLTNRDANHGLSMDERRELDALELRIRQYRANRGLHRAA